MVIPVYDKNPVRRTPVVTYTLIALCTAVFLLGPLSGFTPSYGHGHALQCEQAAYFDRWGVIPGELFHGQLPVDRLPLPQGCPVPAPYTKVPFLSVFTAMFLHGGWLHLIGNMLFLYVFGDNVENRMGRVRFALFYLAAGYLATYGFALAHTEDTQSLVGASGAISGALGAYLYLYPKARVTSLFPFLFFIPLRFPAWMVLGFWFVLQWLAAQTARGGPGVAYLAHVVGFAFGFLCAWVCYRPRRKVSLVIRSTQGDIPP
ncbi:rhomboid family intramembrane serine protease [Actinacidiphila rubida]|uniref:Membrane associated serine protease, rhomboid family n=1 Tax=Actinacidiphila rubida TaxID=310780 RepID=A0A1H8ISC7_9ACTN|nr:rhomboid family intramembrane serine protease [Actinacidiphila rubida]SEN70578.1 Membrane associated serine protease, rhomboid family [Actinacidiphila rubida]